MFEKDKAIFLAGESSREEDEEDEEEEDLRSELKWLKDVLGFAEPKEAIDMMNVKEASLRKVRK